MRVQRCDPELQQDQAVLCGVEVGIACYVQCSSCRVQLWLFLCILHQYEDGSVCSCFFQMSVSVVIDTDGNNLMQLYCLQLFNKHYSFMRQ